MIFVHIKGRVMKLILEVKKVGKSFGKQTILSDVSLIVGQNEIVGLIGPNGSGKSTLMKCICGLYRPNSGQITISDHDVMKHREKALAHLGVSIEYPALYPELNGLDHLKMVATWRKASKEQLNQMIDYTGLGERLKRKVGKYSMGMKQRLILALSLMGQPDLLVLDEPTNGLDPDAVFDLRKKLLDIKKHTSILLSSHQLSELDKLVDRCYFLKEGRIVARLEKEDLAQLKKERHVVVDNIERAGQLCLNAMINQNELIFKGMEDELFDQSLHILLENGVKVWRIYEQSLDLETFYRQFVGEAHVDHRV